MNPEGTYDSTTLFNFYPLVPYYLAVSRIENKTETFPACPKGPKLLALRALQTFSHFAASLMPHPHLMPLFLTQPYTGAALLGYSKPNASPDILS